MLVRTQALTESELNMLRGCWNLAFRYHRSTIIRAGARMVESRPASNVSRSLPIVVSALHLKQNAFSTKEMKAYELTIIETM